MATITLPERDKFQHFNTLSGWAIAHELGCGYSGDHDVVHHGGLFYNPHTWNQGKTEIVEFRIDPVSGNLVVQKGIVYRPNNPSHWESCFSCIGIDDPRERAKTWIQVEAVRCASGAVWGHEYPNVRKFDLNRWRQWRIWRAVYDMLLPLG